MTEYDKTRIERCIKACALAYKENGTWVCPMYINVDKCVIQSPRGIRCRYFTRKKNA